MTPEQLLVPRIKVIDKYPGMEAEPFYVGQIITLTMHESDGYIHIPLKHIPGSYMRKEFFETFPNIFQPLPWYLDRKQEDMPAFIKCDERVWKIKEWKKDIIGWFYPMNEVDAEGESENFANIKWHFAKEKFVPCTLAEYEAYQQSKNK
jgi:hypothetical protein